MPDNIRWFETLGMSDVAQVGGKNASLGEMICHLKSSGVRVPRGFATTAEAFLQFLGQNGLDERIHGLLESLDVEDVRALGKAGSQIREWVTQTPLPAQLESDLGAAYAELVQAGATSVAVRSSATAEDLPEASFAGQQETFLNVQGADAVLDAVKHVFASLFNDRAIAYRAHQGFDHREVALSAGIQHMVRSDLAASGVMFTIDTETGFPGAVFINASYGLGECVVQGSVNPDEFYVYKAGAEAGRPAILRRHLGEKAIKMVYDETEGGRGVRTIDVAEADRQRFSISDDDAHALTRMAIAIERHYGRPMDIEWAKDGGSGELFILQARPETVKSRVDRRVLERFQLKARSRELVSGRSIGQRVGVGRTCIVPSIEQLDRIQPGDVLVTDMTDPNWEPVMKRVSAIVTNRGGRTCHAAIIARELGVPAVVGCGEATTRLRDGADVTVSCAEGDTGYVYEGRLDYHVERIELDQMPELPFKITMNVGNPERAFDFQWLPNEGVGLARLEFVINNTIGIHPKALLNYGELSAATRSIIDGVIAGYGDPVSFYVAKLAEGVATLGAAFHPKPVIVRLSDFKSNEYAHMIGGEVFEPNEENPMLGFRGASRYLDDSFRDCFALECQALRIVRDEMGLTNIWIMVPFVRTVTEATNVLQLLAEHGLERGKNALKIVMMCEIPSNALLAEEFLEHFDGFSIGSNDLTQLTLGLDRDSGSIAHLFDERDPAVKMLVSRAIQACRKAGKYVGICGQGPSDHPDLAQWLMREGIDSVSLNPDSVVETWLFLAEEG